jgi:hypothetical protein
VERGNMHHSEWKEGLQAWGWVEVDRPGWVHLHYFNFAKREQALNSLREGWALAKIQYHNDMWEVVKIYDDPPRLRARVDPWKRLSIESRGMWLEEIAPEELKVKDDI